MKNKIKESIGNLTKRVRKELHLNLDTNKKLEAIQLDSVSGKTVVVTSHPEIQAVFVEDQNHKKHLLDFERVSKKSVTEVQTVGGDSYDPYVGSALAICYEIFGSKREFRRFIDEFAQKSKADRKLEREARVEKAKQKNN